MVGDAQHLAKMANDIGNFFHALPQREDAVAGIANHMTSFWTRRMLDKLIAQMQRGEAGLDELPREAVQRIAAHPQPTPIKSTGSDAG